MPDETPYIKVYEVGKYEVRTLRDSGRFSAVIYEKGKRTDVLTSSTPKKLEEKVERYINASGVSAELEAAKKATEEAREEVAKLTKSLNEMGDGHARAAQYEKELEEKDKEIQELEDIRARYEADLTKCQAELEAAKNAAAGGKKTAKTAEK